MREDALASVWMRDVCRWTDLTVRTGTAIILGEHFWPKFTLFCRILQVCPAYALLGNNYRTVQCSPHKFSLFCSIFIYLFIFLIMINAVLSHCSLCRDLRTLWNIFGSNFIRGERSSTFLRCGE